MSNADQKKLLRNQIRKRLDSIPFDQLIQKSGKLTELFQQLLISPSHFDRFAGKQIISFYPFENEPQINIESEKNDEPYRVAYVRIVDWDARVMIASEARRDQPGQWEELSISDQIFIHQPTPMQPVCSEEEIAAILVPGIGFTTQGKRLGRGAGFYDRFLRNHPEALRIGIAFEEQMIEKIPTDPWDENIDVILTDQGLHRVISTKQLGEWQSQGKIKNRTI